MNTDKYNGTNALSKIKNTVLGLMIALTAAGTASAEYVRYSSDAAWSMHFQTSQMMAAGDTALIVNSTFGRDVLYKIDVGEMVYYRVDFAGYGWNNYAVIPGYDIYIHAYGTIFAPGIDCHYIPTGQYDAEWDRRNR